MFCVLWSVICYLEVQIVSSMGRWGDVGVGVGIGVSTKIAKQGIV